VRAAVASVTAAAFLSVGCSGGARKSGHDLKPATEWEGLYRVTTTTDEYTTRHFSVTDSALVVTELAGTDKHYALVKLPLAIPLTDVKSVERLEHGDTQKGVTIAAIVVVTALIAAIIALKQFDWSD